MSLLSDTLENKVQSATAATSITIAIAVLTHLFSFAYFKMQPSATASTMKSMDVVATAPFAATLLLQLRHHRLRIR